MKPDWSTAPSWANWLAMNYHGAWAWYESKPYVNPNYPTLWGSHGKYKSAGIEPLPLNENWKDTIQPRPEEVKP